MKHGKFTKVLAVILTFALLIPGGAQLASAECDHDFSDKQVITATTCTTDGVAHYRCSKCGEEEKGSDGEVINFYTDSFHKQIENGKADSDLYYTSTTDPTCEDWGVIHYYCDACNTLVCDKDIEPLGHNGVWIIEQDATLDYPGVKSFVCTRCGDVLPDPENPDKISTQEFELHEHCYDADLGVGYQRILTPATCTKDGEMGTFCGICGALFAVEPIEAAGHFSQQWKDYMEDPDSVPSDYIGYTNVETTMPTCTEPGVIKFLCDECGEVVRSYPLEATGHHNHYYDILVEDSAYEAEDFIGCTNVVTTMPTCTEDGSMQFLCDDCGIVVRTETLEATGHYNMELDWYLTDMDATLENCRYGRNVEYTPETCTKPGKLTFLCDTCGEAIRSYTLEPAGHGDTYEKVITAATCTTDGELGTYCSVCQDLLKTTPITALGHVYGEWTPNGDKTHSRSCSRCQFTDKATCKFNASVTDPTCLEGGYTTYVCADCGYTYIDNYTDALGHDWGAWTDDGDETHTRTCGRCGEKETEDHCFGEWAYNHDAKFFKNGTKSMTCEVCGKVVTEKAQFTAWIWHVFYPILLWIGSIVHKSVFLTSLAWFLPGLNITPKM